MAEVTQGEVAPVAAPITPAPEGAPPVSTAEPAPPGEPPKAPPKDEPKFTQKELDRIVAKERREYERLRREAEERVRREYAERFPEKPAQAQSNSDQEPQPDDFKTPQEYLRAWNRWDRQQAALEEQRQQRTQQQQRTTVETSNQIEERFAEADDEYPDLRARLARPGVALDDPMLAFVLETEHGFAVGDYLANNPAESRKIAALTPAKQVLALNEIAGKLKAAPEASKAPPPIVPNSGKATVEKDPSSMSDKEYDEWRKRQIAQRGNR